MTVPTFEANQPGKRMRGAPDWLLGCLVGLTIAGVILGGGFYYNNQVRAIHQRKADELKSIATLKVQQIAQWLQERLADAQMNSSDPFVRQAVADWEANPTDPALLAEIKNRLQVIVSISGYQNAFLTGPDGTLLVSQDPGMTSLDAGTRQWVSQAVMGRSARVGDLVRNAATGTVYLDFAAPVFNSQGMGVAALVLQVDPSHFLYPLIQTWPIPSQSAETLLIRRDGNDALFLNTLRFNSAPPLTVRLPLTQTDVPAVYAALGHTGEFDGRDYRGIEVLSEILAVPGTNWSMVAKVDRSEILAEVGSIGWEVGLVVGLAILMALAVAAYGFNLRQRLLVQELLQAEIEKSQAYNEIQRLNLELEDRIRQSTAQLVAANKELEAFAYSVSHDLRAPLRALDGFSSALMEDYQDKLDEQGKHYLDRIQGASRRMGQLIEDLLNLSRVTRREMKLVEVDLSGMAAQICQELLEQAPDRTVECDIQPGLAVRADQNLTKIVLENLLSNAFKFTSKIPLARIQLGVIEQYPERIFFIRDNGAGFSMDYAQKLFVPFQRLHAMDEFPGTGIGLVTVHRILSRHGGRIWPSANVGQGATFYFTFGGA